MFPESETFTDVRIKIYMTNPQTSFSLKTSYSGKSCHSLEIRKIFLFT